jgi:hypothetical protein
MHWYLNIIAEPDILHMSLVASKDVVPSHLVDGVSGKSWGPSTSMPLSKRISSCLIVMLAPWLPSASPEASGEFSSRKPIKKQ